MQIQTFQPKDAHQALRQAKSFEKAQEIIQAGYYFEEDKEIDTVYVVKPGKWSADYFIYEGKCDCPDFTQRGEFCKHTLAWQILQKQKADEEAMIAQYEKEQAACEI